MKRELEREWLEKRKTGLGGSDAPAVCGVSPWKSPYQVWLEKRGEAEPQEDNEPMYWGRALEPAIRQRYADETGRTVVVPREILRHPKYDWMLANLDGEVPGERIVEIKTAKYPEGWGESGSAEIPMAYRIQVEHYMIVRAYPVADVAVLIGGNDFRLYTIEADKELQELILDKEAKFWEMVQNGVAPEPTTFSDIRAKYGKESKAVKVQADTVTMAAIERLKEIKQLIAEEENLKAIVMGFLKEADTLVNGDKILATWKAGKPGMRLDVKAFSNNEPMMYEKYLKEGEAVRRLLIK